MERPKKVEQPPPSEKPQEAPEKSKKGFSAEDLYEEWRKLTDEIVKLGREISNLKNIVEGVEEGRWRMREEELEKTRAEIKEKEQNLNKLRVERNEVTKELDKLSNRLFSASGVKIPSEKELLSLPPQERAEKIKGLREKLERVKEQAKTLTDEQLKTIIEERVNFRLAQLQELEKKVLPEKIRKPPEVAKTPETPPPAQVEAQKPVETPPPTEFELKRPPPEYATLREKAGKLIEALDQRLTIAPEILKRIETILQREMEELMFECACEWFKKHKSQQKKLLPFVDWEHPEKYRDSILTAATQLGLFKKAEYLKELSRLPEGKKLLKISTLLTAIESGELFYPERIFAFWMLNQIRGETKKTIDDLKKQRQKLGWHAFISNRDKLKEIRNKMKELNEKQKELLEILDGLSKGIIGETLRERAKKEKVKVEDLIQKIASQTEKIIPKLYQELREKLAAKALEREMRAMKKPKEQLEQIEERFEQEGKDVGELIRRVVGRETDRMPLEPKEAEVVIGNLLKGFVNVPEGSLERFGFNKYQEAVRKGDKRSLLEFLLEFIFWIFSTSFERT